MFQGLDASTALFEARRWMSCGNCFGCDNCYGAYPDNAIIKVGDGQYEIDYDYCKGCGICAAECPLRRDRHGLRGNPDPGACAVRRCTARVPGRRSGRSGSSIHASLAWAG